MTTYESLTLYPPKHARDKRLARLERTCKELRQYHSKAGQNKRNVIMRLVLRYESLLERIQIRLEKGA